MCKQQVEYGEVFVLHILAFIVMFVVLSIMAACDGDFSGLVAIGKVVFYGVVFLGTMWLLAVQPILFVLVIIILIAIVVLCSK